MSLPPRGTLRTLFRGIGLIARGRAEGLNCFGHSPRAFIGSLLPGFGFMVAAVIEGLAEGRGMAAFASILSPLCALLAPPVLSYELARLWGREAFWYRYVVAFNWSRWLLLVLLLVMFFGVTLARRIGVMGPGGFRLFVSGLAIYALWLSWFVARHGLALSGGRAALLVAGVNIGTLLLVLGPGLLSGRPE